VKLAKTRGESRRRNIAVARVQPGHNGRETADWASAESQRTLCRQIAECTRTSGSDVICDKLLPALYTCVLGGQCGAALATGPEEIQSLLEHRMSLWRALESELVKRHLSAKLNYARRCVTCPWSGSRFWTSAQKKSAGRSHRVCIGSRERRSESGYWQKKLWEIQQQYHGQEPVDVLEEVSEQIWEEIGKIGVKGATQVVPGDDHRCCCARIAVSGIVGGATLAAGAKPTTALASFAATSSLNRSWIAWVQRDKHKPVARALSNLLWLHEESTSQYSRPSRWQSGPQKQQFKPAVL